MNIYKWMRLLLKRKGRGCRDLLLGALDASREEQNHLHDCLVLREMAFNVSGPKIA